MSAPAIFNVRSPAAAREEVLEELWTAGESGHPLGVGELARTIHAGPDEGWGGVVQELVDSGLVEASDSALTLTEAGRAQAREVVRRHRLAEVLFHQVLDLPMAVTESEAYPPTRSRSPAVSPELHAASRRGRSRRRRASCISALIGVAPQACSWSSSGPSSSTCASVTASNRRAVS